MTITTKNSDTMSHLIDIDGVEMRITPFQKKVLELLERIANK